MHVIRFKSIISIHSSPLITSQLCCRILIVLQSTSWAFHIQVIISSACHFSFYVFQSDAILNPEDFHYEISFDCNQFSISSYLPEHSGFNNFVFIYLFTNELPQLQNDGNSIDGFQLTSCQDWGWLSSSLNYTDGTERLTEYSQNVTKWLELNFELNCRNEFELWVDPRSVNIFISSNHQMRCTFYNWRVASAEIFSVSGFIYQLPTLEKKSKINTRKIVMKTIERYKAEPGRDLYKVLI